MYLNCHTGFSFKYGTLPPRQLFSEAKRCGVHKLVVTEINNTASYLEMLRLCNINKPYENNLSKFGKEAYSLDIAVGIEFRKENDLLYIAIAKNNKGFEAINRFLSHHNREGLPLPEKAPEFENVFVIYPFGKIDPDGLRYYEYIGICPHELSQFSLHPVSKRYYKENYQSSASNEPSTQHPAPKTPFVILHPVTLLPPEKKGNKYIYRDHNAHRLLRCIANNTLLSKLQEHQQARNSEFMVPEQRLEEHFEQYPGIINTTKFILDQCSIDCPEKTDKNKKYLKGSKEEDLAFLRSETKKGFNRLLEKNKKTNQDVWIDRIEKELSIIDKKGFTAYYLITYDLISFAKQKGFDFVGRGSGANSTVAYCLGITNVDPIELDLYFERFLNEERTTPPDFDIDFSWDNRDEIYDYIFKTYDHHHVCLLGTHVTYQAKSIIRELGKVFGLPKDEIDHLVENRKTEFNESGQEKKNTTRDHIAEMVYAYSKYIIQKELPSNISIHAGGVLITEEPIYAYTAIDMPPKGYPVSHFEMHNAEDFGIFKFDILSQRGLGHIKETVRHVKRNRGTDIDVYRFDDFKKDEKIKELMRNSKAMGCFYVESPAMRMLLEKLRCDDYLTLVAASSIIRPGVASSGMMQTYIQRFHTVRNGGRYEAIHPKMDELMKETYGVMVYQEDVIKVAHHFAGLSLTEADVLRRGMSGKYRSREEFQRVRDRFFELCAGNYESKVTNRVWFEIESFSGYSFAKGHSASYAVESYQSLFLKAHYPLEFMVGVINNFGGFYRTEFYFHEARMNGGEICPPDVNQSDYLTTINDKKIYVGFIHLKSLETKVAKHIAPEREQNGPYKSFDNFLRRIPGIGLEQLRILIRVGAFRFTGKSKQKLLWEAMLYFSNAKAKPTTTVDLFDTEPSDYPLPALHRESLEDAFDELELIGFPLESPFRLLDAAHTGDTVATGLKEKTGKQVCIIGYVVTTKDTRTKSNETMHFGTFYDVHGEFFDTVHFPNVARKYPFRGRGFYKITGKVTEDFGIYVIEVSSMTKLSMIHKRPEAAMQVMEKSNQMDDPRSRQN